MWWTLALALLAACGDKNVDEEDGGSDGGGWDLGTGADSGGGDGGGDVGGVGVDADGDGFVQADDCDDSDAEVFPGADERCDGIDNDCDEQIDEEGAVDAPAWCQDGDGDGFAGGERIEGLCDSPGDDWSSTCDDCDDSDPAFHPDAVEDDCTDPNDYDCDGETLYADADGDGSPACEDCDDENPDALPGGTEVCDGADNDCDGLTDDDDELDEGTTWYVDRDGDGYGSDAATLVACEPGDGWVATDDDCDDGDGGVHPGATEVCDDHDVDEDCDGDPDDGDADVDSSTMEGWYVDDDGDGHGAEDASVAYFCDPPAGYGPAADDCDDGDDRISPSATEVCDDADTDEDCDGTADDADDDTLLASMTAWYPDEDGDGFGDDAAAPTPWCDDPGDGSVTDATDCDDDDDGVHPDATEVCDDADVDEDCDGLIDDDDSVDGSTLSTWYADRDGDGHASDDDTEAACDAPGDGWAATAGDDCDDGDDSIHPDATELCNDIDEDCDGSAEGASGLGFLRSSDGRYTDYSDDASAASVDDPLHISPSGDGTLYLCEGTWPVEVEFSSLSDGVTVQGVGAREAIVLTHQSGNPIVSLSGVDAATLSGFTVEGGDGGAEHGGGIYVYNAGDVVIEDVVVRDNTANLQGGGVYVAWADSFTLRDSLIQDNTSAASGGGMTAYQTSVTIEDTTFSGNHAGWGGGFVLFGNSYGTDTAELADVVFDSNTSTNEFGAFYLYRATGSYTATAAGLSRVVSNTGGGIMLLEVDGDAAGLELDGVDFGAPGSDEENDAYDIKVGGDRTTWTYGSRGEAWSGSCHTDDGCE